jgi:hypothetical protein
MWRGAVVSVVLVAGLVAGGCGGVEKITHKQSALQPAEWTSQAEAHCAAATDRMHGLGLQAIDARPPGGDLVKQRAALVERRVGYLEVSELAAPEAIAGQARNFTDEAVAAMDELIAASRAQEAGDRVQEQTSRDRAKASLENARNRGKALGLTVCIP